MRMTDLNETFVPIDATHVESGGSTEGYVVDTDAEQIINWLEKWGISSDYVSHMKQYSSIAFFNNLFVDEEFRGQGVGNYLMEELISEALLHGAGAAYLIADTLDGQADGFNLVKWYEGWGWKTLQETSSGPFMFLEFK